MKLAHSLGHAWPCSPCLPSALANFHVTQAVTPGTTVGDVIACPSDYYNCDCMQNGDRQAEIVRAWELSQATFSLAEEILVGWTT
ncbi:hypothetical protein BS47DRAFT_1340254 [Hydnum rufescens UP504]|uniref:Uncharacterized protein n=1 Tax=Hydnum rufescens UP504 TaxID=1448309 RepID=A0A9P6B3B4_9AGAM|nr:hypothetical protein BS47DRAFT_1340254 [Hydnum rufescens UP504]